MEPLALNLGDIQLPACSSWKMAIGEQPLALAGSSMVVERPFQLDPETLGYFSGERCFGKLILHLVSHRIPHFFGTKKWSKQLEHSPISIHF